jgi:iron(III) transport system ATP-binding protein
VVSPSVTGPVELIVSGVEHGYGDGLVLRDVSVHATAGETLALLGPSGCGKTTLLRIIAGLERPSQGSVQLGDRLVAQAGKGGTFVSPERRRVGMVFQDGALFPHLTVAENVGFGLDKTGRADRIEESLALVGLAHVAHRRPDKLSGGQRQRIAIARALAPRPSVLLLDEPFASLDASLRVELRAVIHRLLHELEITTVLVTHDQDEAFVLGDKVAVMRDGQIRQVGRPAELYGTPVDPWVAGFVGDANLLEGTLSDGQVVTALGDLPTTRADLSEGEVVAMVRPEQLAIDSGGTAVVRYVEFYGHDTVYLVELADGTEVKARVGAAPMHTESDRVELRYVGPPVHTYATLPASADGVTDVMGGDVR